MKKMAAVLAAFTMILCPYAVMAEEAVPAETQAAATAATGTEEAGEAVNGDSTSAIPEEPEIIHIAAGDELPDYFYAVPKEKILEKGGFSLEGLHAYVAIAVKKDYLDPNGFDVGEWIFQYSINDITTMQIYYDMAINVLDEFSYNLKDTFSMYGHIEFSEDDAELVECIMRAVFTYCETTGYGREYLDTSSDECEPLNRTFELTAENITFSDEQLNYFE